MDKNKGQAMNFLQARINVWPMSYWYWKLGFDRLKENENTLLRGGAVWWGRWCVTIFWTR
jgi:hypothetical protein